MTHQAASIVNKAGSVGCRDLIHLTARRPADRRRVAVGHRALCTLLLLQHTASSASCQLLIM